LDTADAVAIATRDGKGKRAVMWQKVTESIWVFEDSCLVYAVKAPEGLIIINAGTGRWLAHLDELPGEVKALLCTHFFRDHSAGAAGAARRLIPIYAPYWEQEQFTDPLGLFQRRETFIIYDNIWDLYSPIEPIEVAGWLMDWDTISLGGIPWRVIPTPGVTPGAISLICELAGRQVAFCGEVIHSPGKIARMAPLQYNYNDLPGAVNLILSAQQLRKIGVQALLPSLGGPIMDDAQGALRKLEDNLRFSLAGRPDAHPILEAFDTDPLIRVSDHVYRSALGGASSWFVISEAGRALAIDYGYDMVRAPWSNYPYPRHRRSMLHGLEGLKDEFDIDQIDVVIVTHFHDDHVCGIPALQRLQGTRCWAGENFAHILAQPMGYSFPCTWPEPIRVEPQSLGSPIRWEEYAFTLHPLVGGHTRWGTIVTFEADGAQFAATGDQYFFHDLGQPAQGPCMHNHVYRNGATLLSFARSSELMRAIGPEFILPGHGEAYRTNDAFYQALDEYAVQYAELHRRTMPLGPEDVHFGVDSRPAWLEPYRARLDEAADLNYRAIIRNPLNRAAELDVRLVGPHAWHGTSATIEADARAEASVALVISPPEGARCRRQPVALELTVEGRPFGQVAEALVTIGHRVW
jgi:glyoxylase-like metal-dependent hydrolase (beta-lactamase superfamily II)